MPHDRFFVDLPFSKNQTVALEREEAHHLARVMRKKTGDSVELVNGKNQLAHAQIETVLKNSVELNISSVSEGAKKNRVVLAQAYLRPSSLEWLIEKATELGCTEFWLFPAERSEKKSLTETQLARLKQITISAMKQCGRLDLPEIVFHAYLDGLPSFHGTLLFGDLSKAAPSILDFSKKETPKLLFIGPEGGFTEKELLFLEKERTAQGVRLHENTLRAETAAVVGIALLSQS